MAKRNRAQPPRVGFIGAGNMGRGMAANIMGAGIPLTLVAHHNRAHVDALLRSGATEVVNPADLATRCDVAILCVPGTGQVEDVIFGKDGIVTGGSPGLIVVDTSTGEPDSTRRRAAALQEHGMALSDAPVSHSPTDAERGQLVSLVGAADETMDVIRPILATYSKQIVHFGPAGAGHTAKLVNNFVNHGQALLLSEAFAACAHGRVDIGKMYEVMRASISNSGTLQQLVPRMLDGELDGDELPINDARTELEYLRKMVQRDGLNSTMSDAVYQVYNQAVNLGYGDRLMGSLFELQERLSNAEIVPRQRNRGRKAS